MRCGPRMVRCRVGDEVHARGCTREGVRPSQVMEGYDYCPACRRMVAAKDEEAG
jgi:hypothetical protein